MFMAPSQVIALLCKSKQKPRCRCRYKTNAMLLMQDFSKFQHGVLTLVCQSCYVDLLVFPARALSARAVTGRRWGGGSLFDTSTRLFFTKTAVAQERKVEKLLPRWEGNDLSEGYKRVIDQNWGRITKIGYFGQKPRFGPKNYTMF